MGWVFTKLASLYCLARKVTKNLLRSCSCCHLSGRSTCWTTCYWSLRSLSCSVALGKAAAGGVDRQQLLQLPLRHLLLQLPVLATPPRRLVVEVSHPAELLSGSLCLAQVGGGTLHRRVRCDRPACWGQRWPATFPSSCQFWRLVIPIRVRLWLDLLVKNNTGQARLGQVGWSGNWLRFGP